MKVLTLIRYTNQVAINILYNKHFILSFILKIMKSDTNIEGWDIFCSKHEIITYFEFYFKIYNELQAR